MAGNDTYTVRQFAKEVLDAFDAAGTDTSQRLKNLKEPYRKLIARRDLDSEKFSPRAANHIEESRVMYFDGELWVTFDRMLKGRPAPAHDHGNDRGNFLWESMGIWSGQLKHTVYERQDDRSVEDYAELKVIEDRILEPGDVVIVGPPAEIHSFSAISDEVRFITVVDGHYPPVRQYFKPEENRRSRRLKVDPEKTGHPLASRRRTPLSAPRTTFGALVLP